MTPKQAALVQDAAGLVAAHLRSDEEGQTVLAQTYAAEQRFPELVDAFVFYLVAAVQIRANLTETSWRSVLDALSGHRVSFIPGVDPDYGSVRQLAAHVIDAQNAKPAGMELISCLEGAYGLAVSVTYALGEEDRDGALAQAAEISSLAAREN